MPGPQGTGEHYTEGIEAMACRHCGAPAVVLGHNANLYPEEEPATTPGRYYPLCMDCAHIGRSNAPESP